MKSPHQHYEAADKILADLDGEDCGLPYAKALIAKAAVHAQLASLGGVVVNNSHFEDYDASTAAACIAAAAEHASSPILPATHRK